MKKIYRIPCMALCAALLISVLCSCSKGSKTVLKVGDVSVSYEEYRYFYLNTKNDMGEIDGLLDEVMYTMKNAYAVIPMAKEYDVSLTSEEKKAIRDYIESVKGTYKSENEYYASMEKAYISEDVLYRTLELSRLKDKLFEALTNDLTGKIDPTRNVVKDYIKKNFYRAMQIFISNDDGELEEDNKRLADELLERVKNGEDFYTLMNEYGEDVGMFGNKNGYYCAPGEKISVFEKTALSLSEGEVSEVVSSHLGYHIIKRLPLEDEYIEDYYSTLFGKYEACVFNEMYAEYVKKSEISYTDTFYGLDYEELEAYTSHKITDEPEETKDAGTNTDVQTSANEEDTQ